MRNKKNNLSHWKLYTFLTLTMTSLALPATAWSATPPVSHRNMPKAASITNLEGTLEIRLADYRDTNKHSKLDAVEYALVVNRNLAYSLNFIDATPAHLKSGARIKVKQGFFTLAANGNNQLAVTSKDVSILRDVVLKEIQNSFGMQKTVVMLVNFQNDAANRPWTHEQVKEAVFKDAKEMLSEFSYRQTSVVGDVVGWYTLPIDNTADCDQIKNSLPSLAEDAAQEVGINLSMYTRYIYMFPQTPNCTWTALATVGGNPSRTWMNGSSHADIITQGLGHNLGLFHSHALECQDSSNLNSCEALEYGDVADTMGTPSLYAGPHFNAYQKERLGWLNFANSPPIQTVTSPGTYNIDAYETINSNAKALKILKETLSDGSQDYYYLEFRQGLGFDSALAKCDDCDLTKGVLVHQANNQDPDSSNLIFMPREPADKSAPVTLQPGRSFYDATAANGGVTISVQSITPAGAQVNVLFGNPPPPPAPPPPPPAPPAPVCVRAAPTMSVSPGNRQVVKQGGRLAKYTIGIHNNDSAECEPANFALSIGHAHQSLKIILSPTGAALAPGGSTGFALSIRTNKNTPRGNHDIAITGVNSNAPEYAGSTVAYLGVTKADK